MLAGENGAGKSTLMKIITGQLKADAGEVSVDGVPLHHADPSSLGAWASGSSRRSSPHTRR